MSLISTPQPRWTGQPTQAERGPLPRVVDMSVCIANWNCRELLQRCLDSLRRQGIALEVIVVDNASTDGAADMVAAKFPEVVLIRNAANRGFATANNQAAAVARGRYLFFLNNDTWLPANTLADLLHFADAHPDAGIIGPRLRDARGAIQGSARSMPTIATFLHRTLLLRWTGLFRRTYDRYRRRPYLAKQPCQVELLLGAALLVRRDVFDGHGGWNDQYVFGGEDLDLCRRVGRTHRLLYHPGIELTHYGRVSTRLNRDLTAVQIPVGFVRFFRQAGCSKAKVFGYKVCVSLDAMLQCQVKSMQYLARRLLGQRKRARKSRDEARRQWRFLTHGLWPFWRA